MLKVSSGKGNKIKPTVYCVKDSPSQHAPAEHAHEGQYLVASTGSNPKTCKCYERAGETTGAKPQHH